MIIKDVLEERIELEGKEVEVRKLVFSDYFISHDMSIDFIDSTGDPNVKAHGREADDPVVPGFQLESMIQNVIEKGLGLIGKQELICKDYTFMFKSKTPVNSNVSGEIYILERDGGLSFLPQIYVNNGDNSVCGSIKDRRKTIFNYVNDLGEDIANNSGTEFLIRDIALKDLELFRKSMKLDFKEDVPLSFLTALSSFALAERIRSEGLFEGKIPIYTSRRVSYYPGCVEELKNGVISLSPHLEDKGKMAKTDVIAYNAGGHAMFKSEADILLIVKK